MLDEIFDEHIEVIQKLKEQAGLLQKLGEKAASTLQSGNTIFFCGNGGSAADSQHLAAEIVGRFQRERKGYPAIALTVDTSALTSIANDYGYNQVFSRQIEALGKPGDMLIGISTSGNSPNVLAAIQKAKSLGMYTVGLTSQAGGTLKVLVDLCVLVPTGNTARVQEAHIFIGHAMCWVIDNILADG